MIKQPYGHVSQEACPLSFLTMRLRLLLCCLLLASALAGQDPFRDATAGSGIDVSARVRGVSVCDPNGDGHPDLFLSVLDGPNRLYQNDGHARFTEVGHRTPLANAGPTQFSLWVDLDGDGDQDAVLGQPDLPARLYRNDGGTFTDLTAGSGLELRARVQAGAVLDYDGDGLPDLFFSCLNAPDRLYRNEGGFLFREVGGDAGAAQSGLGMGCLAFDYDLDGDPDLYLVRDGLQPNTLLRNDGGTFTDVSAASGANVVGDGMGVDAADYDLDGDFDLYVTNLYENFLLENRGDGTFREVGFDARVNDLGMGWGTAWLDYDLDGYPDLYVANETGFTVAGRRYNNILYRNLGNGSFAPAAPPEADISSARSAYGTATADFDGDGRPDLFVGNSGQPSQLFLNTTATAYHWVAFDVPTIGARLRCWSGGRMHIGEVRAGGSYASQHEGVVRFGVGAADRVDSLLIDLPGAETLRYYDLAVDRLHRLPDRENTTSILPTAVTGGGVYPNPTTGHLYLSRAASDLRVFDVLGRLLLVAEGEHRELKLPDHLPPGIYRMTGVRDDRPFSATLYLRSH
ncbi:FG-GAP-like repeat-containing protein [Neolewinella litorea]|uniref:ASPIC/UnbV domain-containing protein n=1 Tax=Neolewinella litorea TaxID=2562452 RepID=A0A4S4NEE5_9BACT|nr:FG-GAP-like repeat-containing protein [Neolewinella litorea]THH37869.1 hypothetical protein E4021_12580 [Neolewinella litorea]